MVHGMNNLSNTIQIDDEITKKQYDKYLTDVNNDINVVRTFYPQIEEKIIPMAKRTKKIYEIFLVDNDLIKDLNISNDYLRNNLSYTKVYLIVPFDYQHIGCEVYGGKWINEEMLPFEREHFNDKMEDGNYKLCLGTTKSFDNLKNVILEACRTAENLFIQYYNYQNKNINEIKLIEYSHGKKGIIEYEKDKNKYKTKK